MKYCVYTVIKDEHNYLDEWIVNHIKLRVDKIFVYEDMTNTKSHKEIVDKYDNVELHSVKELSDTFNENRQVIYFKLFLDKIKNEYDWCFYVDTDEFLTFNGYDNLDDIFSQFNDYDAVEISWQNFNANGHIEKPVGSLSENFTQKCGTIQRLVKDYSARKLAMNLNRYNDTLVFNIHQIFKGKWCNTDFSTDVKNYPFDKIYIRHYLTKSFEEYLDKQFVRGQFYVDSKRLDDFFELNPDLVEKKDEILERYKDVLKSYQIPKKLHYIWLGGEKPESVKKCIESWEKYASDYEIIEWNEKNLKDVKLTKLESLCFVHFYKHKQYAFASDILRLKILYQYGGIYVDTDIEFVKPIPEYMLEHNILGIEKYNCKVASGVMGSFANDEVLKEMIVYFNLQLSNTQYFLSYGTSPLSIFNELLNKIVNKYVNFSGDRLYTFKNWIVYPSEYFYPIDFRTKECIITDNTILIHHYDMSWFKFLDLK